MTKHFQPFDCPLSTVVNRVDIFFFSFDIKRTRKKLSYITQFDGRQPDLCDRDSFAKSPHRSRRHVPEEDVKRIEIGHMRDKDKLQGYKAIKLQNGRSNEDLHQNDYECATIMKNESNSNMPFSVL